MNDKNQLRSEHKTLQRLIHRFGGETNLFDAHDDVAIKLDYHRDAGSSKRKYNANTGLNDFFN